MTNNSQIPSTMIPAYPYEGGLYWLFADRETPFYKGSHPYYKLLYGPGHNKLVPRVTALAALFDRIVIAPADARLPDYSSYISGDNYYHPDLRIAMSWDHNEWDEEHKSLATELLETPNIQKLLASRKFFASDDSLARHFLCRTLLQLRLAGLNNCILVGDAFFSRVCNEIFSLGKTGSIFTSSAPPMVWPIATNTLDVVGLSFCANSIDSFTAIRQSRVISDYARGFRTAISTSLTNEDMNSTLLQLMREAMEYNDASSHVSGAFQTIGSVASYVGLVPILGTIASAVGIGTGVADRYLHKSDVNRQWYLLGPKMKQVALESILSKR